MKPETFRVKKVVCLAFHQPVATDVNQPGVKVKPVPRPRSKLQPKAGCKTNNNILDSVDTANNTSYAVVSGVFHS